jgi:hypothetical protein
MRLGKCLKRSIGKWTRLEVLFLFLISVCGCRALGKPAVLGEFGKAIPFDNGSEREPGIEKAQRHPFFRGVYRLVEDSVASGGALRGSLFWRLAIKAIDVSSYNYAWSMH